MKWGRALRLGYAKGQAAVRKILISNAMIFFNNDVFKFDV